MIFFRKITITLLVLLLIAGHSSSQTQDIGGLTSIELTKALNKKTDINIGEELRFDQQLSNLNRSKTWVEMDYSLLRKRLSTSMEYNLLCYDKENRHEMRHRLAIGLTLQERDLPVRLKLRSKVQTTWRDESRGSYTYNPKFVWRNKLTVDRNFKQISLRPYASGEIILPLNGKKSMILTDIRTVAGVKYRVNKASTLDFYLRYDVEVQQKNPASILYGGIGWNYTL